LNIKNIKLNYKYDTYNDLCEALGIEVKKGDSKKIQLFELESYFKYEIIKYRKHSFIITEIYDEPKPIITKEYVQIFLLKILYNCDKESYNSNCDYFEIQVDLDEYELKQELLKIKEDKKLYDYYKYNWNIENINKFIYKNNNIGQLNKENVIDILITKSIKSLRGVLLECLSSNFDYFENHYLLLSASKKQIKEKVERIFIGDRRENRKPSFAEQTIEKWLWQRGINYAFEYNFFDIKYIEINNKFFDFAIFYNNELVCLLEYDGEQHYRPVEEFGGVEAFERTVFNDKIKNKYCEIKNYKLIRIKYIEDLHLYYFKLYEELNKRVLPLINNKKEEF
jgi:hypothetical protein